MTLFLTSAGAGFALYWTITTIGPITLSARNPWRQITSTIVLILFCTLVIFEIIHVLSDTILFFLAPVLLGGFFGFWLAHWLKRIYADGMPLSFRGVHAVSGFGLLAVAFVGVFHEPLIKMAKQAVEISVLGVSVNFRPEVHAQASENLPLVINTTVTNENTKGRAISRLDGLVSMWCRDLNFKSTVGGSTSNAESFPLPLEVIQTLRTINSVATKHGHNKLEQSLSNKTQDLIDAHRAWMKADLNTRSLTLAQLKYQYILLQNSLHHSMKEPEEVMCEDDGSNPYNPSPNPHSLYSSLVLAYWLEFAGMTRSAAYEIQSWLDNRNCPGLIPASIHA